MGTGWLVVWLSFSCPLMLGVMPSAAKIALCTPTLNIKPAKTYRDALEMSGKVKAPALVSISKKNKKGWGIVDILVKRWKP